MDHLLGPARSMAQASCFVDREASSIRGGCFHACHVITPGACPSCQGKSAYQCSLTISAHLEYLAADFVAPVCSSTMLRLPGRSCEIGSIGIQNVEAQLHVWCTKSAAALRYSKVVPCCMRRQWMTGTASGDTSCGYAESCC